MTNPVQCALCPLCGGKPAHGFEILWPDQAFCDNEGCSALCWNPRDTLDENILQSNAVRLPDWLR